MYLKTNAQKKSKLKPMLIKTAFITKLFSDHIKEKVLVAKKKDLFGGSTLKKK